MDTTGQQAEIALKEAEEVMDVLKGKGPSLEGFRREYLELQNSVETLTESFIDKEREIESLQTDIIQVRDQSSIAKRNIEETTLSVDGLQSNLESLRQNRIRLMEREMSNRSKITVYSQKFDKLHEALEIGSGWTPAQDEERQTLEKENDFLIKNLDNKNNLIIGIRLDSHHCYDTIQSLEQDIQTLNDEIETIQTEMKTLTNRSQQEFLRCRNLELKVKQIQQDNIQAENDYQLHLQELKSEDQTLLILEKSLKNLKSRMDQYIAEYDGLYSVTQNLTNDLEKQKSLNKLYETEIQMKKNYIETKVAEIQELEKDLNKMKNLRQVASQKITEIDQMKTNVDLKKENLQEALDYSRDHEMKILKKQNELLLKQKTKLNNELDILQKKSVNCDKATHTIDELIFVNQNTFRNLLLEKKLLTEDIATQYRQIQLLLQEKEKHEHDTEITNQEYYTALEELKLQELQIKELQKKITDDQNKLKHKQNLYEAVRADRNLYSKQLIESQEEINNLKKKFRLINHIIDQIKEEINSKDHSIVKEHFHHHSVDKERELLKNELTKIRKQVLSSEQIIENQHVEVLKLTRIIEEAELEKQRQNNELIAIISERNLLTAQVVKRNYELSEMYDKIKVQRSNLRIGERYYNVVIQQLKQLREELINLIGNNNLVMTELEGVEPLKRQALKLQKNVLQEQTKKQALVDELSRPMNVHRWRILESSDPQRYEKICQIQLLHKELIKKSDEVIERDLLIQEKEKVYIELKNIITRQPGPEVEEQIVNYQLTLKEKLKQYHLMNNELEMYRMQVQTFKNELIEIDEKIQVLKRQWKKTQRNQNYVVH
jgi:chromosome segregation ATPase